MKNVVFLCALVDFTVDGFNLRDLVLDDLPDTGEQWTSLPNGVEFQPANNLSPLAEHHLRKLTGASSTTRRTNKSFDNIFVDGAETVYDEYAQAWRALGFYIDCNYCDNEAEDDDDNDGEWLGQRAGCNLFQNNRALRGDDDEQGGCQRFMLWAAYIDEEYSGNQIGEYKFFDRRSGKWSDKACKESQSTRCVKMDCHLPNTHFKLLGFFKEPEYDTWFEQLFKHQGYCVWTEEEYKFMQYYRELWPTGCTESSYYDSGKTIYYNVKPARNGNMDIGLYVDSNCVEEYTGSLQVATVMMNEKDDEDDDFRSSSGGLDHELDVWNGALDVFKQCQPCKAYKLTDIVAGLANKNGYLYSFTSNLYNISQYLDVDDGYNDGDDGDDDNDEDEGVCGRDDGNQNVGYFQCSDDAGYCNVNQCMKFATKTRMIPATYNDVFLAAQQDSIVSFQLPGTMIQLGGNYLTQRQCFSLVFFCFSILFFVAGLLQFQRIVPEAEKPSLHDGKGVGVGEGSKGYFCLRRLRRPTGKDPKRFFRFS